MSRSRPRLGQGTGDGEGLAVLPGGSRGSARPPGGPWARPRRSPPLALPESRRESPGPAPSAAPRASPERGQGRDRPRPRGAGTPGQGEPGEVPHHRPRSSFSKPQTCRWLFWSRVPRLHPCPIYVLEKPVILDRNSDCEIVLCAPLQRVTSDFFFFF